jgi:hypothetical protein
MRSSHLSIPLLGCIALGLGAAGCSVQSDPTARDEIPTQASTDGQARIADATLKLEEAFSVQFTRGQIDRAALQGPIDDVVQAMPEAARPKVQQHIGDVLDTAEKLTSQLTAEQRAQVAAAPSQDHVGHLEQFLAGGWGWPGAMGWGGLGAFGFPGMFYGGGLGLGTGLSTGYSTATSYSTGYSTSFGTGLGCGFGVCGGLGGLGWFW